MAIAIRVTEADNVVVLFEDVKGGETVTVHETRDSYVAREDIHKGNKMAIAPIKTGEAIIKYGIPIGLATADAAVGELISAGN
ncbi:MAG: UxaA family hydrolase, partial [Peptococcaceae bacterium]|nr:UxaA family hydrolase [Peptococcaceae bacterium]